MRPGLLSTVVGAASTDRSVNGRPYTRSVAEIGVQIADALEHAHQAGVIHRDIKPSNLLLEDTGKVWITDFGLAQFQNDAGLTMTGDLLGTLRYMSPEAASGKPATIDHRTDIYALGVTLYELLTLHPAFVGSDRQTLIRGILNDEPPPPRRINKSIPVELETIVLKAIHKEPSLRYASAREFGEDLQRFLDDRPIAARRPSLIQRVMQFSRRHRGVVTTALISVAVLLITVACGASIAAVWLANGRDAEKAAKGLAEERLFESLLTQAKSSRLSDSADRMFQTKRAIEEAAELASAFDLSSEQRLRLRNEAIASMAIACGLREVVRWPQQESVAAIDFDIQLQRYAYGNRHGDIIVRRVDDNSIVAKLKSPGEMSRLVRFSPSGTYIYDAYGSRRCAVWDVAQQRKVLERPIPPRYLGFDFSPDDSLIAIAGPSHQIDIYRLPSGEHHQTLAVRSEVGCVRFHPDGQTLAVGHQRLVECWDLETGRVVQEFPQPDAGKASFKATTNLVNRMTWNDDGSQLLTVLFDRARIWDVVRGEEAFTIPPGTGFYNLGFSKRNDLLGARTSEGATVWDAMSGEKLVAQEGSLVRLGLEGNRLAFHDGHDVGISEVVFSDVYRTFVPRSREQLHGVTVSGRWPLVATTSEDGIRLWTPQRRREIAFLPIRQILGLVFHDASGSLLLSTHSGLYRWPISRLASDAHLKIGPPTKLDGPTNGWGFAGAISFSPDESLVTRCVDPGEIRIFASHSLDKNKTSDPITLDVRKHWSVCNVSVSNDRKWAVTSTAHGDDVWLWNVAKRSQVRKLWEGTSHTATKFSPDGNWCLVVANTDYQLFEVDGWRRRWRIPRDGTNLWPGPFAFSPDSQIVAIESDRALCIVSCSSGVELCRLQSPGPKCAKVEFSPDGQRILELSTDRIGIWDLDRLHINMAGLGLDLDLPHFESTSRDVTAWNLQGAVEKIEVDYGELFKQEVAKNHAAKARWFSSVQLDDNARREYEKAVSIYPEDALACNNLAWLYAAGPTYLRSSERALALAEHAIDLEPENANYLNTVGVVYYRCGQWQQATETLLKSIELDPQGGTAFDFFFLSMIYHQNGDTEKSQEFYDRAVAWWNAQSTLPDDWRKELVAFRAEADLLFKDAPPK